MKYNSDEVLMAWKAFVGQGVILKEFLQPEVADSWQRCKDAGLDPWSVDFPKSSKQILQQKREENKYIIEKTRPILDYLLALLNSNLSLGDREGFIFELITPLGYYPRTYGTYIEEAVTGNGSITIAYQTKKPIRLDGYEHFRAVSQRYSGVSAPIFLHERLVGVLTITNPFVTLPNFALDCCITAAEFIGSFIEEVNNIDEIPPTSSIFGSLIEKSNQAIVVLDRKGRILITNKIGRKIVDGYDRMAYGERSFGEYLVNKQELTDILDFNLETKKKKTIHFKKTKDLHEPNLLLNSRKLVQFRNGVAHIVLVIQSPIEEVSKIQESKYRAVENTVDYIGQSEAWKKVNNIVKKVAHFDSNVLILGETGAGKEVVAKAIHRLSGRTGNFVAVNCGAIPRELFASELFGYESGAFTGAKAGGAIGKFEYAHEGTLFLDEIGEMPLEMQVILLRVLQEKTITRIGSNISKAFDVRIVAATNQNIRKIIQNGGFRSDLYYRLSVIEIPLPSLKKRQYDIALLAEHFNRTISEQLHIPYQRIPDKVIDYFLQYDWPGNVRELKNLIEKLLILSDGSSVTVDLLPDYLTEHIRDKEIDIPYRINEVPGTEKELICMSLEKHQGNISQVAKELGMARNTVYRKIEKYQIETKTFATNG